jgi:glycolate oxidase FAD binding subunit
MTDSLTIDDFGPLPVNQPATVAELGECIRSAVSRGQAIYPVGGGTHLGLGLPPTKPGVAIRTTRLDQVIDYPARDMTVTVQAGMSVARLQHLLAIENQRLPVDFANPERSTLGGALAANVSGPRRYGFGTLRDYVIGISLINGDAKETKAGGRVVKNVAGYDLCKLYVGSLGTLGIITQVTLKVRPRPEENALVVLGCSDDTVGPLLDLVHASLARPVCLELFNAAAVAALGKTTGLELPSTPWVVVIGFEDNCEAVSWQLQQVIKEATALLGPGGGVFADRAADPLWEALTNFPAAIDTLLTVQTNLLPHATAGFCKTAVAEFGLLLQAHAGNGIVIGHAPGDMTPDRAAEMVKSLLEQAQAAGGNLIVTRCPSAWKATLPVWGAKRGDALLMRRVKECLDPTDTFNPGRFVV